MKVTQLLFHIKNLQETSAFYQKLGLELTQTQENFAEFKTNDFVLQFLTQSSDDSISLGVASDFKQGVFVYVEVEDVDATHTDLISKGFVISRDPVIRPWGKKEFALKDPNGINLVFFHEAKPQVT